MIRALAFVWPLAVAVALLGLRSQRPDLGRLGSGTAAAVFALGALSGALAVLTG